MAWVCIQPNAGIKLPKELMFCPTGILYSETLHVGAGTPILVPASIFQLQYSNATQCGSRANVPCYFTMQRHEAPYRKPVRSIAFQDAYILQDWLALVVHPAISLLQRLHHTKHFLLTISLDPFWLRLWKHLKADMKCVWNNVVEKPLFCPRYVPL